MRNIIIEIKTDNADLFKSFIPYFQTFNKGLNSIGITPTIFIKNNVETTRGSIEELIAQRDTYIGLTNVYKDLSKGRKDTKTVVDYLNGLEVKLDKYKQALDEIEEIINNILNSCLGRNTVSCRPAHNVCGDLIKILDIINKAKGKQ